MTPPPALLLLFGLVLLVVGAEFLVRGSSRLAAAFGISPLVVGLTVVAFGTSAPELAVSVMSAFKGQGDLALGNVVGSNLFNVLFILGLSAVIVPLAVAQQLVRLDLPAMVLVAAACLPLFFAERRIGRRTGACFLAAYVAYVTYLVLSATAHPLFPAYRFAMAAAVLPAALLAVALVGLRGWRKKSSRAPSQSD